MVICLNKVILFGLKYYTELFCEFYIFVMCDIGILFYAAVTVIQ